MTSLVQSLNAILPSLHPALADPDAVALLRARAGALAPIHRAGFECRLDAKDGRVDLQQCVLAAEGDVAPLRRFIEAGAGGASGDALDGWQRLGRFCDRWVDPSSPLRETIGELWLECDLPRADSGGTPPSVFALLLPERRDAEQSLLLAKEFLRALLEREIPTALGDTLDRCSAACPAGARISHVGVMLGRETRAIRIHVSRLPVRAVVSYLSEVGWPGDAEPLRETAQWMLELCDDVVFCLDVASSVLPQVGLEAFIGQHRGLDPRWQPLIGRLVARGICAEDKARGLLQWPGRTTPLTSKVAWPDALVAESVAHPADQFSALERRLSHIKFTLAPGSGPTGVASAKAYFGYAHLMLHRRRDMQHMRAPSGDTARASLDLPRDTKHASRRAARFLLATRDQAGWWRDFHDVARHARSWNPDSTSYPSDEWVTAYVGAALAALPDDDARTAARDAWDVLLARRDANSGWGYHLLLPHDADSTAWALRLAARLGVGESPRARAALAYVRGQQRDGGGFATYSASDLAAYVTSPESFAGWCAPHVCVTAAVVSLGANDAAIEFLLAQQQDDGRWTAHWWDDDEYSTARAVDALTAHGGAASRSDVREAVRRASHWAASRIAAHGAARSAGHGGDSAFATALAMQAISAAGPADAGERAALTRAAAWLVGEQREDGSYPATARMLIPPLSVLDPLADPERTAVSVDGERIFTTATVLAALHAFDRTD